MRKLLPLAAVSALGLALTLGACSQPAPEETPSPTAEPTMAPADTSTEPAEAAPADESGDRGMTSSDANPVDRP